VRRPLAAAALCLIVLLTGIPGRAGADDCDRMIVLGIDGLDPILLQQYMDEGILPSFAKLATEGSFIKLGTSIPPQSPVAWSNFITGMDPGGHGIFDFVGLDRKTLGPYLSTSRVEASDREPLEVGKWRIPLGSGQTLLLRDGEAFFKVLEDHGVPTTMFRVPANYPPIETGGRALSGMGTPDMRGTSGTFMYFTDDPNVEPGSISGGEIRRVVVRKHRIRGFIEGPRNEFIDGAPRATAEFTVHVDPEHPVAEIRTGDERAVLNVGEWSDWLRVDFDLIPYLAGVRGMSRFYLKEVSPQFRLYASPVNIDPAEPAQPIATPEEYAWELEEAVGPFYTQELPEETKALSAHLLTPSEFLTQSGIVLDERRQLMRYELDHFRNQQKCGLLFFYFSSVDLRCHMLWRQMDEKHPFHDHDAPPNIADAFRTTYRELDELTGWAMREIDERTTLLVMSDHGFTSFRRQANLNTWLEQNGYLKLENPDQRDSYEWLQGIDWGNTRAFGIGLNSLYINVEGRERYGIVAPQDRQALAREIADKLASWKDPENDQLIVTQPVLREEVYHGSHVEEAPDILVGYANGYRASWGTASGEIPAGLLEDNDREWSGDHCIDSRVVPGVLLSNHELVTDGGDLKDLSVTILNHFGIEAPEQMKGRSLFAMKKGSGGPHVRRQ